MTENAKVYIVCHVLSWSFRLLFCGAVIWLTWYLANPWCLCGLAAGYSYKHDFKPTKEQP